MKRTTITCLLFLVAAVLSGGPVAAPPGSGARPGPSGECAPMGEPTQAQRAAMREELEIERIEVMTRNWENHGTDIVIEKDGKYVVSSYAFRRSKKVREGRIARGDLDALLQLIRQADLFALPDEYKAPFKSEYGWWGYQLTVRTPTGVKSIRYHSDDETVPADLKAVVERVRMLAR